MLAIHLVVLRMHQGTRRDVPRHRDGHKRLHIELYQISENIQPIQCGSVVLTMIRVAE